MEQTKYYVQQRIISTNFNEGVISAFDLRSGIGPFLNGMTGRIAHEIGKKKSQVKIKKITFNSDKDYFDCDLVVTEKFPQNEIEAAFKKVIEEKYEGSIKKVYFASGFDYHIIVEVSVPEKFREQFSNEYGMMEVRYDLQSSYKGLYGSVLVQVYQFV